MEESWNDCEGGFYTLKLSHLHTVEEKTYFASSSSLVDRSWPY
jgi:hypothetical protein